MAKLKEIATEFCNSYSSCDNCPARKTITSPGSCVIRAMARFPTDTEDVISELYHWFENRPEPVPTRASFFFDTFPGAEANIYYHTDTGKQIRIPRVCARHVFSNVLCEGRDCKSCWLRPLSQNT